MTEKTHRGRFPWLMFAIAFIFVLSTAFFSILWYMYYPSKLVEVRCSDDNEEGRYYGYGFEMNQQFSEVYAAYLMREGALVKFNKRTSKIYVSTIDIWSVQTPFVKASKNATAVLLYGVDASKSSISADSLGKPLITCDQVKRVSAKQE